MKFTSLMIALGISAGIGYVVGSVSKEVQQEISHEATRYDLDELLKRQLVVDRLSFHDLKLWFLEEAEKTDNAKGILMKMSPGILKAICKGDTNQIDSEHYLLQGLYKGTDSSFDETKLISLRLINYNTIGEEIVEKLNECGMLLINL